MRITVKELKRLIAEAMAASTPPKVGIKQKLALRSIGKEVGRADPEELKSELKGKLSNDQLVLDMDDLKGLSSLKGEIGNFFRGILPITAPTPATEEEMASLKAQGEAERAAAAAAKGPSVSDRLRAARAKRQGSSGSPEIQAESLRREIKRILRNSMK